MTFLEPEWGTSSPNVPSPLLAERPTGTFLKLLIWPWFHVLWDSIRFITLGGKLSTE